MTIAEGEKAEDAGKENTVVATIQDGMGNADGKTSIAAQAENNDAASGGAKKKTLSVRNKKTPEQTENQSSDQVSIQFEHSLHFDFATYTFISSHITHIRCVLYVHVQSRHRQWRLLSRIRKEAFELLKIKKRRIEMKKDIRLGASKLIAIILSMADNISYGGR